MQPDQGELEREHWHVAMMRVTGHPDGTRSYASRQVEIDYPTAMDAAAVIASSSTRSPRSIRPTRCTG